jgi:tetratricopeptide (TPR) repeat protein
MTKLKIKTAALLMTAAFIALFVAGCASTVKTAAQKDLTIDPLHIEVDPNGNLPPKFWDSYSLMQQANALYKAQNFREALVLYKKIVDEYPQSDLCPFALFNIGACREKIGEYDKAFEIYKGLEQKRGATIELKELLIRETSCLEEMKRWNEAVTVLTALTGMFSLTQTEHIDVTVRLGIAYYHLGDSDKAKSVLHSGLSDYRKMTEKQLPIDSYFVAKGYFYLGEIYFDRYEKLEIAGQESELPDRLEAKAELFIMARAQYLRCIQTYQGLWMEASLYKLGRGYEIFYFAMRNYPVPGGLSPEQIAEYNKKLAERTSNVLAKAVEAYQKSIELDRELALHSDWMTKSRERLDFLLNFKKENGL